MPADELKHVTYIDPKLSSSLFVDDLRWKRMRQADKRYHKMILLAI